MLLILLIVPAPGCRRSACPESPATDNGPLLLLDNASTHIPAAQTGADNSRCHVCHLNYAMEEFSVRHAAADIGCEQCHGPSDAHCGDEDNITPPDRMFPRAGIIDACLECHRETLRLTAEHKPVLARKVKKVCTDCHGEHRLTYRTRRWNRETGELITDDKVRMMTDEMLGKD